MSGKHPLDRAFDIDNSHLLDDDYEEVVIPDDPTLDTIIEFALKAYKTQMEDVSLIEPKNRIRYLEIAERFLEEAKDAMYKKEYLKVAREKLERAKLAPVAGSGTPTGQVQETGTPRTSLFGKLKEKQAEEQK
jgi:hypothetical protein